ncbi:MAG TPA: tetratricopeptide repeat protein [Pseudomonadales bacterium]|nr:tetratricopeptide repeat protein [Pseudomonadales bacterium]
MSASAPDPAPAPAAPWRGIDPAANMASALAAARSGDRSLARAWLDPLLIAPRISREGRASAYYLRGLMFYLDGLYVSAGQDYRRALEFVPTLAEARNALAWLHLKGRGVNPDSGRAVALYRLAARQGHTESRFNLALLLMKGTGTARAPREALAWFEAAADDGHVEAAALAGQLLARGDASSGLRADPDRARPRLLAAAEAGHAGARLELGMLLVRTEPVAAEAWLLAAASQGVAAAQTRLGHLYDRGAEGVAVDRGKALMWFREAAKQGDASAQSWLGWAYDAGVGVDPDPRQALRWYERAARRDDAVAQLNLAQLYQSGRGTVRSAEQALYWFEQAAEQGELSALSGLAWLLATAPAAELRDGPRAVQLARQAVARDASAQALDVLAAALAETGQFDAAVDAQERAIRALAAGSREDDPAAPRRDDRDGRADGTGLQAFVARLESYRTGHPWRAD